jgi:hypothetical protein
MSVVPAGEVPGAVDVVGVVDQVDGQPAEQQEGLVRSITGPPPAPDLGQQ